MRNAFNRPLLALALAAFCIGTTEFVIMGLLPRVAADLAVSIPSAGLLVSGYALGVAAGGPLLAVLLARVPARASLLALLALFVAGNVGCAVASNYSWLLVARITTSFCHAAFFGIGAVIAAETAPDGRRAQAIAVMIGGLTVANVLGVPLGTFIGQFAGWRMTFLAVAAMGAVALLALAAWIPRMGDRPRNDLVQELRGLMEPRVWVVLLISTVASAGMFAFFTYVTPYLVDVVGIPEGRVSWVLFGCGLGLTAGNVIGARLADWNAAPSLAGMLALSAASLFLLGWGGGSPIVATVSIVVWGTSAFAVCTVLQAMVVERARRSGALASTLNISAFNLGNAIGAGAGALSLSHGLSLGSLPVLAGALALVGMSLVGLALRFERTARPRTREQVADGLSRKSEGHAAGNPVASSAHGSSRA